MKNILGIIKYLSPDILFLSFLSYLFQNRMAKEFDDVIVDNPVDFVMYKPFNDSATKLFGDNTYVNIFPRKLSNFAVIQFRIAWLPSAGKERPVL